MKYTNIPFFVALFTTSAAADDVHGNKNLRRASDGGLVDNIMPYHGIGQQQQDNVLITSDARGPVPPTPDPDTNKALTPFFPPVDNVTPGPTVNIPRMGKVQGLDREEFPSIAEFRGVPYAEPPVGTRRWKPPMMHRGWVGGGTFSASAYGNSCWQLVPSIPDMPSTPEDNPYEIFSEDCLHLHIATPKAALETGTKKLPVMIWIHGGAMSIGKASEFDAASLVAASGDNIVVVTINYRLNVFGVLGGDSVMAHTKGAGAGNFGIQDQRMAMAWVKENIGAFGGDGDDVTIFGQSAGALSVLMHLVQPASFPLYNKAIIESFQNLPVRTMEEANEYYNKVLVETDCKDERRPLKCLLNLDAESLLEAGMKADNNNPGYFAMWPVIDGVSLTDQPDVLIDNKQYNNKVPIMIGGCRDEVQVFRGSPNMTQPEFDSLWNSTLGPHVLAELKEVYSPESYRYPADLGNYSVWSWMDLRVRIDSIWTPSFCGSRWMAKKLLAGNTPSVHNYMFAKAPNYQDGTLAVHGSEVPYVFGMTMNTEFPSPDDEKMSKILPMYWSSFAISGNPNPTGATELDMINWPQFTEEDMMTMRFGSDNDGGITVEKDLRGTACDWKLEHFPE